jgi:hypothetical protein
VWNVANVYWNTANEPPETRSTGQTSNVCFHEHMQRTIHSGTMKDRNGS